MKLNRLLLETVADQLHKLSVELNRSPDDIKEDLKKIAGAYWKWLLTRIYNDDIRIDIQSPPQELIQIFRTFDEVYHRLPNKDINQYKSYEELRTAIEPYQNVNSSAKQHDLRNMPGVEIVDVDHPYMTVVVDDVDSLQKLGEGTKWCTREGYGGESAQGYIDRFGELFIVLQNGRPVMQYTPDYSQIKDINNRSIEYNPNGQDIASIRDKKMLSLISLPPLPKVSDNQDDLIVNYNSISRAIGYFESDLGQMAKDTRKDISEYIDKLGRLALMDKDLAILYLKYVRKGTRWPEAEDKYYQDPSFAYSYSIHTGKRFERGEPAILTRPIYIISYIKYIIRKPWPEGEQILAKDPEYAVEYARLFYLPNRWPLGEKSIKTNAKYSYEYANLLGQRFPEGEPSIAQDPHYALKYAINILNDGTRALKELPRFESENGYWSTGGKSKPIRFLMGEKSIARLPAVAFEYTYYIIRGKWPEGEPAIKQDHNLWIRYLSELSSINEAPTAK